MCCSGAAWDTSQLWAESSCPGRKDPTKGKQQRALLFPDPSLERSLWPWPHFCLRAHLCLNCSPPPWSFAAAGWLTNGISSIRNGHGDICVLLPPSKHKQLHSGLPCSSQHSAAERLSPSTASVLLNHLLCFPGKSSTFSEVSPQLSVIRAETLRLSSPW